MSKGLGKNQRWILCHAYLKLRRRLPATWECQPDERQPRFLHKWEILRNRWHLEPSTILLYKGRPGERLKYPKGFQCGAAYNRAMVAYRRAVKRLDEQGYVKLWNYWRWDHSLHRARYWGGDRMTLTPKGRRQARALLKAIV